MNFMYFSRLSISSWTNFVLEFWVSTNQLCYYDLRLGSGCNLGKDLREERGIDQLVKHKEYRIVSTLYILVVYEESIGNTWGEMSHNTWG